MNRELPAWVVELAKDFGRLLLVIFAIGLATAAVGAPLAGVAERDWEAVAAGVGAWGGLAGLAWLRHLSSWNDRLLYGPAVVGTGFLLGPLAWSLVNYPETVGQVAPIAATVVATWVSVTWVQKLRDRLGGGAAFHEGVTTVRAVACVWWLIALSLPLLALAELGGADGDLHGMGTATIAGVGAVLAYAGPGYSQYRRAVESDPPAPEPGDAG